MDIAQRVLAGERRALARLLTLIENKAPEAEEALRFLHQRTGRARTLGVTGSAGTGKSTLVAELAKEFRQRNNTIGIVAVDPSSPFTRGAFLGDRIRMQDLYEDPGVFIRSMATRGALGGLAETTCDVVSAMDAFGFDIVVVETVGAGQDEVDVTQLTDTILVVTSPDSGDDMQMMKAGILEIADIYVVNKADQEGAHRMVAQLQAFISLAPPSQRPKPVVQVSALTGMGVEDLADEIEGHWRYLTETGRLETEGLERARQRILGLARNGLMQKVLAAAQGNGRLDALAKAVAAREVDPHTAAEMLMALVERKSVS